MPSAYSSAWHMTGAHRWWAVIIITGGGAIREYSPEEGHLGQKLKSERELARKGWNDVIGRRNSSCKSSEVRER